MRFDRYESPYAKTKGMPRIKGVAMKKCSPHHWQYRLNGVLLNYWPTKRKWEYGGVGYYAGCEPKHGIRAFIRDREYEAEQLKGKSCEGCANWIAGVLGDEIWGECKAQSTNDLTHFTECTEVCMQWEKAA